MPSGGPCSSRDTIGLERAPVVRNSRTLSENRQGEHRRIILGYFFNRVSKLKITLLYRETFVYYIIVGGQVTRSDGGMTDFAV